MLRVHQLKLPLDCRGQLEPALRKRLELRADENLSFGIIREALDARKDQLWWVYTVDARLESTAERRWLKRRDPAVVVAESVAYHVPEPGNEKLLQRPIVVGAGPAGLLAALLLAEQGYAPILLERGGAVEQRVVAVERFWGCGDLDPENNVQFGEGGAGTFSDGKLNTQIRDPRIRKVLQTFVEAGAPAEILFQAAPHLGTDRLRSLLVTLRKRLQSLGATLYFGQKVERVLLGDSGVRGVVLASGDELPCSALIFAIGHSARDTLQMLYELGVPMQAKSFSLGVRIEQLQSWVDEAQYGAYAGHAALSAAAYKLVYHTQSGRTVYTFCMCPGGEVVASASEAGGLVINGMSYAARDTLNANAALLVNVAPEDYGGGPLDGIAFQRHWEEQAFAMGGGGFMAPIQRVEAFLKDEQGAQPGLVQPSYRPGVRVAALRQTLPDFAYTALQEALPALNRSLPRFADPEALLTALESRSSSPVRILRDERGESAVRGLYPAGEGAGYAGGIVSAAVDGLRAAEAVIRRYRPLEDRR